MAGGHHVTRAPLYLSAVFLALACAATAMTFINRDIQANVNARQLYINQGNALSQINQALIKSLGAASVKNAGIKKILTDAGFTVTYNPGTQEQSGAAAPETPSEKKK